MNTYFIQYFFDVYRHLNSLNCHVKQMIKFNSHLLVCNRTISLMSRVFANGPGDEGSILGCVIPKTKKMILDATLLNTQHYKVWVKWSNSVNGVVPSPAYRCGSYWKGSLRITLEKSRQLYLLYLYPIKWHSSIENECIFYLTHRWVSNNYYSFRSVWIGE